MFGANKAVKPRKSIFNPGSIPAAPPVVVPNRPPAEVFEFPTFGRDDSLFKQPVLENPAQSQQKLKKRKKVKAVEFDFDSRREYLTGFHKRKVERTNARRERAKEREKIERREERKERRSGKEKAAEQVLEKIERVRDVVAGKIPVKALEKDEQVDDGFGADLDLDNNGLGRFDSSSEDGDGKEAAKKKGQNGKRKREDDGPLKVKKQKTPKPDSTTVFTTPHAVTTVTTFEGADLDEFLDAATAAGDSGFGHAGGSSSKPKMLAPEKPRKTNTDSGKKKKTKANPHFKGSKGVKHGKPPGEGKHGGKKHRNKHK